MSDNTYGLDMHCQMILEEYRAMQPTFKRMKELVLDTLEKMVTDSGMYVTCMEARIKKEKSLAGKLALKGYKYPSLSDLTDILGTRIVVFYTDDVDKVASMLNSHFNIDWTNSVDKRKVHEIDSFGYMSLHYICSLPEEKFSDPEYPDICKYRFEIQIRTALQHVWATMEHDTGYKSEIEIPKKHMRQFMRLAGLLELADEQFSQLRMEITDFRRRVGKLVADGNFDEVDLTTESFTKYLEINPFKSLIGRISSINQAEIFQDSMIPYFLPLKKLGFKTLGDIEKMKKECSDDAYSLAVQALGRTDLDIISSSIALKNLCIAWILRNGGGENGLRTFFTKLRGEGKSTESIIKMTMKQAKEINLI